MRTAPKPPGPQQRRVRLLLAGLDRLALLYLALLPASAADGRGDTAPAPRHGRAAV